MVRHGKGVFLLLLVIGGGLYLLLGGYWPSCLLKKYIGLSCPMCGTTRAFKELIFHCDIAKAFYSNPIFWLWGFWLAVFVEDVLERSFGATKKTGTTLGMRCLRAALSNPWICAAHLVLILAVFVHLNWFG